MKKVKKIQRREPTEEEIRDYMDEFGLTREETLTMMEKSDEFVDGLFDDVFFPFLFHSPMLKALRVVELVLLALFGITCCILLGTFFLTTLIDPLRWLFGVLNLILWLTVRWFKNRRFDYEILKYMVTISNIMAEKAREARIDELYGRE